MYCLSASIRESYFLCIRWHQVAHKLVLICSANNEEINMQRLSRFQLRKLLGKMPVELSLIIVFFSSSEFRLTLVFWIHIATLCIIYSRAWSMVVTQADSSIFKLRIAKLPIQINVIVPSKVIIWITKFDSFYEMMTCLVIFSAVLCSK